MTRRLNAGDAGVDHPDVAGLLPVIDQASVLSVQGDDPEAPESKRHVDSRLRLGWAHDSDCVAVDASDLFESVTVASTSC
jgi:hypothetical protein